jgi:uncharacterized protein DUF6893
MSKPAAAVLAAVVAAVVAVIAAQAPEIARYLKVKAM